MGSRVLIIPSCCKTRERPRLVALKLLGFVAPAGRNKRKRSATLPSFLALACFQCSSLSSHAHSHKKKNQLELTTKNE